MDVRPPNRRRKRSRFASNAPPAATQPFAVQTDHPPLPTQPPPPPPRPSSPKSTEAQTEPLSLPTFTRGKYKFAARRHRSQFSESKSIRPPDRASSLFTPDDDDSDHESTVASERPTPLLPTLKSITTSNTNETLVKNTTESESIRPNFPLKDPSGEDNHGSLQKVNVTNVSDKNPNSYNDKKDEDNEDPLDSFMQSLNQHDPTPKRMRISTNDTPDLDHPDSPSLSDQNLGSSNPKSRPKRVYEKVDHSKIDYPPFEKNLYIPVPELCSLTQAQILARRRELDNMRVRGRDCPHPISAWAQCGLSSALLGVLRRHDYISPTPIQAQAVPCIMAGRDVIGIARTGSGKTLAFLLPLFRHISRRPRAVPGDGPAALVIAPTRELAMQIFSETKRFSKAISIHCVCAYGGSGLKDQIAELKRGADIIICTPGRMIDLLAMNSGRVCNLRRVTFVVLDEADRMFDMGFEPQLTRIVENIRPDRQTVMFSATFPVQVEKIARKILHQPIEIMVGGNSVAAATIDQHVEVRKEDSKFFRLLELLGIWYEKGSTLVFVDRQDNADRIFRDLSKARYKCLPLHGGMDQADRDSTIVDFKNGDVKVLIATSVAARGLDVKNLTLVVNYDVPSHYEDYVHRVGRTGRAGRSGTAYTFITPDQESFAPDLVKALEKSTWASTMEQTAKTASKEEAKRAADEAAEIAVPEDLRQLAESFEQKRKAGVVKYAGKSGYGGRGFKFEENDDEYNAAKTAMRKMQAKQYGIEDDVVGDEEDDDDGNDGVEENGNRQGGSKVKDKDKADGSNDSDDDIVEVKVKNVSTNLTSGTRGDSRQQRGFSNGLAPLSRRLSEDEIQHLLAEATRKAEQEADSQRVDEIRRRALIAQAKAQVLSVASIQKANLNGNSSGSHANDSIHAQTETHAEDGAGDVRFAGELEINEYPANARWGVVRKGALADVEEFTGCVVTTRGKYYPPGRNPPAGERKLHFLIEGPSRNAVKTARRDIQQKLEETSAISRPGDNQYTKYSVV